MANEQHVETLRSIQAFFDRTVGCLKEEDAEFAPKEGMFTVAQHIAHAAQAVEWFMEGAFRPEGMNLDFEGMEKEVRDIVALEDAMAWWTSAMQEARASVAESAPEAWDEPIRGELMAGAPRHAIIGGINDHCAHHRGALAVYARLLGREPEIPYSS